MPRNHKICHEILEIFQKLIAEENLLLACTDEDLVHLLNQKLFVEHRISYRTFQRYKRRALREAAIPNADPLYIDLFLLLKSAYVKLRQQLLTAIYKDHGSAKRYMWILERKFKEWNIKWEPKDNLDSDEDMEGPIDEQLELYPTYIGTYHDPEHMERPKDIAPVHHAIYQGYVIPNPEYDGDEDDTTRAIRSMWQSVLEQRMEDERREALMAQRRAERQAKEAEEAALLAERAQGARPPSLPDKSDYEEEQRYKKEGRAGERLLAKIKSKGKGFHELPPEENDRIILFGEDGW